MSVPQLPALVLPSPFAKYGRTETSCNLLSCTGSQSQPPRRANRRHKKCSRQVPPGTEVAILPALAKNTQKSKSVGVACLQQHSEKCQSFPSLKTSTSKPALVCEPTALTPCAVGGEHGVNDAHSAAKLIHQSNPCSADHLNPTSNACLVDQFELPSRGEGGGDASLRAWVQQEGSIRHGWMVSHSDGARHSQQAPSSTCRASRAVESCKQQAPGRLPVCCTRSGSSSQNCGSSLQTDWPLVREGSYLLSDACARSQRAAWDRQVHRQASGLSHGQGAGLCSGTDGQLADHVSQKAPAALPTAAIAAHSRREPTRRSRATLGANTCLSEQRATLNEHTTFMESATHQPVSTAGLPSCSVPRRFASHIPRPTADRLLQAQLPRKSSRVRPLSQIPRRIPRSPQAPTELSASFEAELKDLADDPEVVEMVRQHLHSSHVYARKMGQVRTAASQGPRNLRLGSVLQTGGDCAEEHRGDAFRQREHCFPPKHNEATLQVASDKSERGQKGTHKERGMLQRDPVGRAIGSRVAGDSTGNAHTCMHEEVAHCAGHERVNGSCKHNGAATEAADWQRNTETNRKSQHVLGVGNPEAQLEAGTDFAAEPSIASHLAPNCSRGLQQACKEPGHAERSLQHSVHGARHVQPTCTRYARSGADRIKGAEYVSCAKRTLGTNSSDRTCRKPCASKGVRSWREGLTDAYARVPPGRYFASQADAAMQSLAHLSACVPPSQHCLQRSGQCDIATNAAGSSLTLSDQVRSGTVLGRP
jgi:hypothetical protein